jgi:hypothetical protein
VALPAPREDAAMAVCTSSVKCIATRSTNGGGSCWETPPMSLALPRAHEAPVDLLRLLAKIGQLTLVSDSYKPRCKKRDC